jgi:hypothetical protein
MSDIVPTENRWPRPVVLKWEQFFPLPQGHLEVSRDCFLLCKVVVLLTFTGDAAKHPIMHREAPCSAEISSPRCNEVEKYCCILFLPYLRVLTSVVLVIRWERCIKSPSFSYFIFFLFPSLLFPISVSQRIFLKLQVRLDVHEVMCHGVTMI